VQPPLKHATPAALKALAPLMAEIRRHMAGSVTERKPGTFYRKGQGLLHFHEDPAGFFADLKIDGGWMRFPVNRSAETATFMTAWRRVQAGLVNSET
jgi:hypothetical protein